MPSTSRVATPFVAASPKAGSDYFDGFSGSTIRASGRGSRPATPLSFSPALAQSSCGFDTQASALAGMDRYGAALGIGLPNRTSRLLSDASQTSSTSSGRLSSRRPSLRISSMPFPGIEEDGPRTGVSEASSGSSSDGDSVVTVLALGSLGITTSRDAGGGRARFSTGTRQEVDSADSDADTPRVSTFAAAMRNAARRATPYPSSKHAYFTEDDEEDEGIASASDRSDQSADDDDQEYEEDRQQVGSALDRAHCM